MIYLITVGLFLLTISIATLICLLMKIFEQKNIKNKRIQILNQNIMCKNDDCISQFLFELYTKAYSHFLIYCIGHFLSILVNIYSIILSIASLSMITFDYNNELTSIISLLSTFFVVTLVFSRLDERSSYHYSDWKQCEKTIIEISQLMSDFHESNSTKEKIYSLILTNNCSNKNIS